MDGFRALKPDGRTSTPWFPSDDETSESIPIDGGGEERRAGPGMQKTSRRSSLAADSEGVDAALRPAVSERTKSSPSINSGRNFVSTVAAGDGD